MILLGVEFDDKYSSVEEELPGPNLQIDPRAIIDGYLAVELTFDFTFYEDDDGTNVVDIALTKQCKTECRQIFDYGFGLIPLKFRVYDPAKEVVPRFDTTTYTYFGLEGERAPLDTVNGIIHALATVIGEDAFWQCNHMKFCMMHDNIERIEKNAFHDCSSLRYIKLPRSLTHIGELAFCSCRTLNALFIPSRVECIEVRAFQNCKKMKILSLPPSINNDQVGGEIIFDCDSLFRFTQIEEYEFLNYYDDRAQNSVQVHQSLFAFYRNLPPLHKVCMDTNNVTAADIRNQPSFLPAHTAPTDHGRMTPLHMLAMNPYAESSAILAYLRLDLSAAISKDDTGMCPLDYLWECRGDTECLISVIQVLCIHRDGGKW